jgi:hypothetical protein
MATPLLQPSFSGGELAPGLRDRVDIQRYGTSVAKCRGFIVRAYGGLENRPGTQFVGEVKDSAEVARLIKFQPTATIAYAIVLNDGYMEFIFEGAYVESSPGVRAQVVSPYTSAQIFDVKFTQSNDVMYLTHGDHKPRELRRLTATSFELREFDPRNGPFRTINADEAQKMAASAPVGNVTLTANYNAFSANAVGTLVYLEQKDLTGTRPWEVGERDVVVGVQRRSDGKTYRASAVPATPSGGWIQTGANKPVHESGKAWDGPGDTRDTGTNDYTVGVEWEYLHSGYGIVQITGYTSPTQVTGVVTKRLPDAVVGGIGSPANTWTLSGDGTTKTFALAGATSDSENDYNVTIGGTPVQSNPYYEPPVIGGGSGGSEFPQQIP